VATRGFLIRFIDIGLIVLFGFLMISDIEASSSVELAGSRDPLEELQPEDDDERAFVVVAIGADGSFLVGESQTPIEERVRIVEVEVLSRVLRSLDAELGVEDREVVVLIEPHPMSLVQRTVDVMDVCDRLGLPKSLGMNIDVAPGADP